MNSFAVLFLCIQVCLVQNVFSQCLGQYAPAAAIAPGFGPAIAPGFGPAIAPGFGPAIGSGFGYPGAFPSVYPVGLAAPCGLDSYGGAGEGNVAVAGELPVCGSTAVAGQVPIMGAVSFGGPVPAAGTVTIAGNCACGCGSPYAF